MRIFITGGTGLIGSRLRHHLTSRGHQLVLLSRQSRVPKPEEKQNTEYVQGDPARPEERWLKEIDTCDAVINLVGENLFAKRWATEFKQKLRDSRLIPTAAIASRLAARPVTASGQQKIYVSASAIGIYGDTGETEVDESSPLPDKSGTGLANLCRDWEAACEPARQAGVRVCHPRIGIVLDKEGGALQKMALPFRLFVGGPMGTGKQYLSWIHWQDMVRSLEFMLTNSQLSGVFNCVAPEPVNNWGFSKALGQALSRPSWLPAPGFALRLALGEVAETVLGGQRVSPKNLREAGFEFHYPTLKAALSEIYKP